jgi:hypothetical protein
MDFVKVEWPMGTSQDERRCHLHVGLRQLRHRIAKRRGRPAPSPEDVRRPSSPMRSFLETVGWATRNNNGTSVAASCAGRNRPSVTKGQAHLSGGLAPQSCCQH